MPPTDVGGTTLSENKVFLKHTNERKRKKNRKGGWGVGGLWKLGAEKIKQRLARKGEREREEFLLPVLRGGVGGFYTVSSRPLRMFLYYLFIHISADLNPPRLQKI